MSAVEHQVIADASRIHDLTESYVQAQLAVEGLTSEVGSEQAEIDALSSDVASSRAELRGELILGYVGEYSGSPAMSGLESSGVADPAVRAGYIDIATGRLRDTLDSFTARRDELSGWRARLVAALASRQRAAHEAASLRDAALTDARLAQTRLDQLQTQLTSLQEETPADQSGVDLGGGTQGLPAGGGLLQVVTSELVPPTTTPAGTSSAVAPPTTAPSRPAPTSTSITSTTVPSRTTTTVSSWGEGGAPGVWLELRICESGDNYAEDTGNGYYGAYQFSQGTWTSLGFPGRPDLEPPGMQDAAAKALQARSGWGQWPACSAALGL
jgi:hypothetical protein